MEDIPQNKSLVNPKMKQTHPDKLLVWSTQVLRCAEQINPKENVAGMHISAQVASRSGEEPVHA